MTMHTFESAPQRKIKAVYGQARRRKAITSMSRHEHSTLEATKGESHPHHVASSMAPNGSSEWIDKENPKLEDAEDKTQEAARAKGKKPSKKVLGENAAQIELVKVNDSSTDSEGEVKAPGTRIKGERGKRAQIKDGSSSPTQDMHVAESSDAVADTSDCIADETAVEALVGHLERINVDSTRKTDGQTLKEAIVVADSSLLSQGPSRLLEACNQNQPHPFSDILDDLEEEYKGSLWRKIGEASYSEVFSMEGTKRVIKVIPLESIEESGSGDSRDDSTASGSSGVSVSLPERSYQRNVRREVSVTRTLSKASSTFVKLHAAYVARGPYPRRLLRAWDAKSRKLCGLNIRPDVLPDEQLYSVLVLSHAGRDLENVELTSWKQAAGVFCQVVKALADAEQACHFEHRDLHWGNVVVRRIGADKQVATRGKRPNLLELIQPKWAGMQATIIDFTLARAEVDDAVTANPFDDEAYFTGQGDIQFDVYRQMRDVTKGRWKEYHPRTNALWLNYLLVKLLSDKGLKPPRLREAFDDGLDPAADIDKEEQNFCFAILSKVRVFTERDMELPETRARFGSAGAIYRFLATTIRGLT